MEVMLLGIVTLVNPLHPENAEEPMDLTARLLIVDGITKSPVALGLLPVMVMVFPSLSYNNSIAVEGLTVRVSDWFPVPVTLLALIVMLLLPTVVGVPEMTPVSGLMLKPAGRPVAAKLVGALSAVMV